MKKWEGWVCDPEHQWKDCFEECFTHVLEHYRKRNGWKELNNIFSKIILGLVWRPDWRQLRLKAGD